MEGYDQQLLQALRGGECQIALLLQASKLYTRKTLYALSTEATVCRRHTNKIEHEDLETAPADQQSYMKYLDQQRPTWNTVY